MLAEKEKTNKWLAEQVGKDPATISKWCTNTAQPSLEMLLQIAKVLNVEVKDLLRESDECIYNHRTTKTNQKYPSVNL